MNETLATIHRLRSVRGGFTDRAVEETDLRTVIDAALRAANSSNRQSYSIIVLRDGSTMRELFGSEGPVALVFCVDFTRITRSAEALRREFAVDDTMPFVTGSMDAMLAAQTAAIAAKSIGIDSLFTNGMHRGDIDRAFAILGLPERHCFPLVALVLGYPAEPGLRAKGRLAGKGIVHEGRYAELTEEEAEDIVRSYDDEGARMGLIDDWNELGFGHYLDWFYAKWSKRIPPETIARMRDRLRRSGFVS
jgi:FMN reductase [NAD(P)H]